VGAITQTRDNQLAQVSLVFTNPTAVHLPFI
jgi:hypothetical protein